MGKRIIQQARGKGGPKYRARKKAFRFRISYPSEGQGKVLELFRSSAFSAPIAKIKFGDKIFYNIAVDGLEEGQEVKIGEVGKGNIAELGKIPVGTEICNIESIPFCGPKFVRAAGTCARIVKKLPGKVIVRMPSKKEKIFDERARATIGVVAGSGITEMPILKAGKMFYIAKARGGRVWPRTSGVKMNIVDHPFGGGRGKRIKAKIPKKFAPPGAKVGMLRPKRK